MAFIVRSLKSSLQFRDVPHQNAAERMQGAISEQVVFDVSESSGDVLKILIVVLFEEDVDESSGCLQIALNTRHVKKAHELYAIQGRSGFRSDFQIAYHELLNQLLR